MLVQHLRARACARRIEAVACADTSKELLVQRHWKPGWMFMRGVTPGRPGEITVPTRPWRGLVRAIRSRASSHGTAFNAAVPIGGPGGFEEALQQIREVPTSAP